jgi:hypothetical protein
LFSEYSSEIAELGVFYASIYNSIIVLKTAETTFFMFYSLMNILVSFFRTGKNLFAIGTYSFKSHTYSQNIRFNSMAVFEREAETICH